MVSLADTIVYFFNFIGRLVCHQIPERTFWIGNRYLPVCARCTGAYFGFYIGYLLLPLRRKEESGPPNLWITLLMTAPLIVDAATQWMGFRTSTNELRLMTGLLFGVALAPLLVYLLPMVPTSRKLPIVRDFLPKRVKLDDKNSWLSHKAFGLGLILTVVLFFAVNAVSQSSNYIFYWILSPLITVSVLLHVFLLPILVLALSVSYLIKRDKSGKFSGA